VPARGERWTPAELAGITSPPPALEPPADSGPPLGVDRAALLLGCVFDRRTPESRAERRRSDCRSLGGAQGPC